MNEKQGEARNDFLLSIRGLSVAFPSAGSGAAVDGVDFDIGRGEALGIVGESGCGKSVTWMSALGLLGPDVKVRGSVVLGGRDLLKLPEAELERIRGRRVAMIFQDPSSSLNPVHSIGDQLGEALELHRGLGHDAARQEARRLLERVGVSAAAARLRQYSHELSGGMNQRVMIAMALAGEPDLLVADEPTTALDVTIEAQILDLIDGIRRERGMALVLISHDLGVVADLCDRIAVMYAGRVVEEAAADTIFEQPRHPYTRGLLAALPDMDGPRGRLVPIPGSVPTPGRLPPGCVFAPRCSLTDAACRSAQPALADAGHAHRVACLKAGVPAISSPAREVVA